MELENPLFLQMKISKTMKSLIILTTLLFGSILIANAQWQAIETPGYSNPYYTCSYYTNSTVASDTRICWSYSANCSVGMGGFNEYEIFISDYLGASWISRIYENSVNIGVQKIDFISADTGYYIRNNDAYFSELFQTKDFFNTYEQCFGSEPFHYRQSIMLGYNDMYIIDEDAKILHLENDSLKLINDLPVELSLSDDPPSIAATPAHYLFIACKSYSGGVYSHDLIINSYDGGYTWDTSFISTNKHINSVKFESDNIGIAVGDNGLIMKTVDAGQTWDYMVSATDCDLLSIDYMNPQTWMAGGTFGILLLSVTGGATWHPVDPPSANTISTVKFPNKDDIVYINQAGLKWASISALTSIESQQLTSMHFKVYPNPAGENISVLVRDAFLKDAGLEIFDLNGRLIYRNTVRHELTTIDCSTFAKGLYFVKFTNQGQPSMVKLAIQ